MKKTIIGLVIIVCITIGAYFVFNYNSEEKTTLHESEQIVDVYNVSREIALLTNEVKKGLKDIDVVGGIHIDYQESVTIQTSIKSSDKDAEALKRDIEKTVKEILNSEELKSVSKVDSYKIFVSNKDGDIMVHFPWHKN
ncbi:hypothetical protein [Guptibacillus hwajinpoensis]|uniref:Flagellar basal body-associated protein FliL n=1 Tax=Guptibacillus hwajinpoensis TaxID=208199 RepID=A0ABU0K038_9BACL|nr:hypothetical protein [Alkalihalobacillus hemicentroti]MDQ0481778.1 flagellar basal body-associated protein FliL [Alkalihalobacillus hemicentroti]